MWKEIGSNFWMNPSTIHPKEIDFNIEQCGIKGNDRVFLSSGRAAIAFALENIKAKKFEPVSNAVIPPFTCDTVIQPFIDAGISVSTYKIKENLYITGNMLKEAIEKAKAQIVLIHRYFGFNTIADDVIPVIEEYRKKGIIFIEDRTQNLFSDFLSLPVDYIVGSFRKWTSLPDGGYCVAREHTFKSYELSEDPELVEAKLKAFALKFSYMEQNKETKEAYLQAYVQAENILDNEKKYFAMSNVSKNIFTMLNVSELKKKRRMNYQYLWDLLENSGQYHLLTEKVLGDETPLYLAILDKNRGGIQSKLRNHAIYAPIVWPKSDITPPICNVAQRLYDEILCIPIDQRYDLEDMKRVADILLMGDI